MTIDGKGGKNKSKKKRIGDGKLPLGELEVYKFNCCNDRFGDLNYNILKFRWELKVGDSQYVCMALF